MYRIAVIQNEVEMQHSGYVDSVPKYRKQDFDLREHVFNRFSSVNIRELFIDEYSCAMKSHFRKFGNQMSGSGNHLCNYASLLA